MKTFPSSFCPVSWSVSRGRDTYGYNICRIDSGITGARFRCSGGGYDMVGTVLADLICAEHQDALRAMVASRRAQFVDAGYSTPGYLRPTASELYGLTVKPDGTVHIDGACGKESVISIAKCAGISVTGSYSKRGRNLLQGFFISPLGE